MNERVKVAHIQSEADQVKQRALKTKEELEIQEKPKIDASGGVVGTEPLSKDEVRLTPLSIEAVNQVVSDYNDLKEKANSFCSEKGISESYHMSDVDDPSSKAMDASKTLSKIAQECKTMRSKVKVFEEEMDPKRDIKNQDDFLTMNTDGEFYQDLIDEINGCYRYGMRQGTTVLSRKLIENLVLDVLREECDDKRDYFDVDRNQFEQFHDLIEVFGERIEDMRHKVGGIDEDFIEDLHSIRKWGNQSAHTLENNVSSKEVGERSEKVEEVARKLNRLKETY